MTDYSAPGPVSLSWILVPLLLAMASVIVLDWAYIAQDAPLTREGGGIETVSMLGYLFAGGVYLWIAPNPFWPVTALLALLAAREADADKAFTSEGLRSTKVILRDTPLWEKALALGVWALLLAALFLLIRHRGAPWMHALARGTPWSLAFAAGLAVSAFSKIIDGLARKLAPFGIDVAERVQLGAGVLEESLELLIPVFFVIAICLRTTERRQRLRD